MTKYKKNIFGNRIDNSSHYKTVGDHWKDNKFMGSLNLMGINENDVQYAMENPMHTFGPLGADAKILTSALPALGTMWNTSKTRAFMNTPFTSAAITPWQGLNTYWGAQMASHIPKNLEDNNSSPPDYPIDLMLLYRTFQAQFQEGPAVRVFEILKVHIQLKKF